MRDEPGPASPSLPGRLAPGEEWWCPLVPGLHLRQRAASSCWYVYYRIKHGPQRRRKIGDARFLSLAAARKEARQALAKASLGVDPHPPEIASPAPAQAPPQAAAAPTMSDLWARYWSEWALTRKKPASRANDETLWRLHIEPVLGARPVAQVTRSEVAKLHASLAARKHNANRVLALLSKMFALAVDVWELRASNPVRAIPRFAEHKRKRVPTHEEVARIVAAVDGMRAEEPWFAGLVMLLILTGCRLTEIMHARRDWIHDGALWLPDSKGGERAVVLSSFALAEIARIPLVQGNPHLIAGRLEGRSMMSPYGYWRELLKRADVQGLRIHDLRRLFASTGVSTGHDLDAVGQLLGHSQVQTTRGYAWLVTPAKRAAAEEIGRAILRNDLLDDQRGSVDAAKQVVRRSAIRRPP